VQSRSVPVRSGLESLCWGTVKYCAVRYPNVLVRSGEIVSW
jgi:hypothetical protein